MFIDSDLPLLSTSGFQLQEKQSRMQCISGGQLGRHTDLHDQWPVVRAHGALAAIAELPTESEITSCNAEEFYGDPKRLDYELIYNKATYLRGSKEKRVIGSHAGVYYI